MTINVVNASVCWMWARLPQGRSRLDMGRGRCYTLSWVLHWNVPQWQVVQVARGTAEEAFLGKGSQHLPQRMGQEESQVIVLGSC